MAKQTLLVTIKVKILINKLKLLGLGFCAGRGVPRREYTELSGRTRCYPEFVSKSRGSHSFSLSRTSHSLSLSLTLSYSLSSRFTFHPLTLSSTLFLFEDTVCPIGLACKQRQHKNGRSYFDLWSRFAFYYRKVSKGRTSDLY